MTDRIDIANTKTPELWALAELALNDYRWRTALDCVNEIGQRFDDLVERTEHQARTATYTQPNGRLLPCTGELNVCESDLPPAFASVIDDGIARINDSIEQGGE